MGLRIDKAKARRQLERALVLARSDASLPIEWHDRTQRVALFQDKTCLVVLGTALLATATDDTIDALALKSGAGNKAYSARGLAHGVLVPASVDHGFDLRTTGREPLNNQPFFHSDRVDAMPRVKHPEEIAYLVECLEAAHYLREDEAVLALASFLRDRITAKDAAPSIDLGHSSADLAKTIAACDRYLESGAESGKRAQALVAASFDLVFDDVRTARVFDPSRELPGDVQAFHKLEPVVAAEVRAKPVSYSDAVHFLRSVAAAGFPHALIAGFATVEGGVAELSRATWSENGAYVTVYTAFSDILLDALAWSRRPMHQLLADFPRSVVSRLKQLEVRDSSLALWGELIS